MSRTSTVLGPLGPGDLECWPVVLKAGRVYEIYAEPSDPTVDFDLYVYDENDNPIDTDEDWDSDALCIVAPEWTGPFNIVVRCERGFSTYELTIMEYAQRKPLLGLF